MDMHYCQLKSIYFLKRVSPRINARRNKTINTANKIFAIEAAPAAKPVNPNNAAIIAIIKKIADHLSMRDLFF
jgi:hypothetical protein